MKIVYVAGPFRGPHHFAIHQNIYRAERLALEVWRQGAVALCPHLNTAHFQGAAPDDVWLKGDLEMLKRCDAVITTADWQNSEGAKNEVAFAQEIGLPVFHGLPALSKWLTSVPVPAAAETLQPAGSSAP